MKSKTIAVALASVLASPLALANLSIAAGGKGPPTLSRTYLEAGVRFRATGVKAEAEVEFAQGTINGVAKTKLGGEVETVLVNPNTPPVAANIDATVQLGTASCSFTNDPRITGPITVSTQTQYYKVEFQGLVSQSGTDSLVVKGLDCGGTIPTVALGDTATVIITGLPDITLTLSAKFVQD
jgi:hypothetical protein